MGKEYIDLALLMNKEDPLDKVNMQVNKNDPNQFAFLANRTRKITSISEWHYLMGIYVTIYIQAHPEEGPELVTYMNRIYDMWREEPNTYIWRTFDEEFRKGKK